jgi:hypothetical protein
VLPLVAVHLSAIVFPSWDNSHQKAFQAIKNLIIRSDCLTTINHDNMGDNKIFITCNASDWHMGVVLSFGPSWEMAHPVAFDSTQLKDVQLNYTTHEKELLAIIHALSKWHSDLLGSPIIIYTNHCTLKNQKDLSCHQVWWMEYLSQYDHNIVYIKSEDNTVTDTLS